MMGHITDTYHDIAGLGIEHLRNLYASSGLSIRPKTELNKIETMKALARTLGLDPDVILSKEALQRPHRTIIDGTYQTNDQALILSKEIKKSIIEELKNSRNSNLEHGSPGEIRTRVGGSKALYPCPLDDRAPETIHPTSRYKSPRYPQRPIPDSPHLRGANAVLPTRTILFGSSGLRPRNSASTLYPSRSPRCSTDRSVQRNYATAKPHAAAEPPPPCWQRCCSRRRTA